MSILEMSFSSAVLIIAVVIIRALALHKLPKKTFLVLWGIVLLRLLIPFSIPSRFSAYSLFDWLMTGLTQRATGMVVSDGMRLFTDPVFEQVPAPHAMPLDPNIGASGEAAIGYFMPGTILMLVWLVGAVACAIFFIVTYRQYRREFNTSLPVDNSFINRWLREHPIRRTIQIRQSDKITAPLTYGIWKPIILLPKTTDWTDEVQLKYILTHEYVHVRRFDTLTKLVLAAAFCIHWFNPLVWVMYILANRDIELSCDETVVKTFGEPLKSAYALTLIELEEKKSQMIPLCNNFSKNAIEERINAIMKIKKYSAPITIVAVLLVVGVTVGFLTSNEKASGNPNSQDNTEVLSGISPSPVVAPSVDVTGNTDEVPNLEDNSSQVSEKPDSQSESTPTIDGEETAERFSDLDWVWPIEGSNVVTSLYGNRLHPVSGEYKFSDHISIAGDQGAAVYAALNGTVSEASVDDEQGNYIVISHDGGIETIYRHLAELQVSEGDTVAAGDTIGTVGSTGKVTGTSLSFSVYVDGKATNPLTYLKVKS